MTLTEYLRPFFHGSNVFYPLAFIQIALLFAGSLAYAIRSAARKKGNARPSVKPYYTSVFSLFLLSQLVFAVGYALIICNEYYRQSGKYPFSDSFFTSGKFDFIIAVLSLVIAFTADLFFIAVMIRSSKNERLQEAIRLKEFEQRINQEYNENISNSFREAEALYYEMKDTLHAINAAFDSSGSEGDADLNKLRTQLNAEFEGLNLEDIFTKTGGAQEC